MRELAPRHYTKCIQEIMRHTEVNHFKGWDPYDILNCRFISDRKFNHKLNILLTQINRISPINFRSFMGIEKIYNSKAMGLFLSSALNLDENVFSDKEDYLLNWLVSNKSKRYKEYSIGFTYDISLKGYVSLHGEPSLIITLFVMYAFIQYCQKTGDDNVANHISSFRELIDRKLPKVENKDTLWYSYLFDELSEVYNATAKVGKYYALIYQLFKEEILLEKMDKILNYLLKKQRADGSWAYAAKTSYTDGFHTAFVLEAIYEMLKYINNKKYNQMFKEGLNHYQKYLFKKNGQPIYFHRDYPPGDLRKILIETDIRDCAMAIVLFARIGQIEKAEEVLAWTLDNMYNEKKGFFYYYKNKFWKNKIEFVRWQAWMLYAFSVLVNQRRTT